jgi:hypothetical protein
VAGRQLLSLFCGQPTPVNREADKQLADSGELLGLSLDGSYDARQSCCPIFLFVPAGACTGNSCRELPTGSKVRITVKE